jgi:hypothetical protein
MTKKKEYECGCELEIDEQQQVHITICSQHEFTNRFWFLLSQAKEERRRATT